MAAIPQHPPITRTDTDDPEPSRQRRRPGHPDVLAPPGRNLQIGEPLHFPRPEHRSTHTALDLGGRQDAATSPAGSSAATMVRRGIFRDSPSSASQRDLRTPASHSCRRGRGYPTGRLGRHRPPGRRLRLPFMTVLAGMSFDPCQRVTIPLIRGKVLHIRFDRGNLPAEELRVREIGDREVACRTGREPSCRVIQKSHDILPLRRA